MFWATFNLDGKTYKNYPVTDISKDWKTVVIQISGDKHLYIPVSKCESILEIVGATAIPENFKLETYLRI